jgi:hypothetical protein
MKTNRRTLLRSLGLGAAALPFVPLTRAEAGAERPKRLVFLFSTNGMVREQWVPSMSPEGVLVPSFILEPLAELADRLLVVDGLRYAVAQEKGDRTDHFGGMNTALTGSAPRFVDPIAADFTAPMSRSVDQHIGKAVCAGLRFRSLELGVLVSDGDLSTKHLSWGSRTEPLPPQDNPFRAYERIFGAGPFLPERDPALEQRALDRTSVLDFVRSDLARVRARLGAEDVHKMDAHLEAIRRVERTLATGLGAAATDACAAPDLGEERGYHYNDEIPLHSRLQIDMLVMALACDLTRVGTIQYGRAGATHRFTWLGPEFVDEPELGAAGDGTQGIHGLAHAEYDPVARGQLAQCHRWYAGEMAYLMRRLHEIPEGDGTMLDNTLVVWMNELGTGGDHGLFNTPWVIGGNAGGYFRTGRVVHAPDEPHNRLLVSLCNAMGLPDETFGDPDYGGALADLT